jgi:hypothetical protein
LAGGVFPALLLKERSSGSTVSSATAVLLRSSSSTAVRSVTDNAFRPYICVASSARDTSGTRKHCGCCHDEIHPYSPPRHLMGTPTRSVAFAMNSLHLRMTTRT